MATVIWITGLPGSGKSTVASAVKKRIPDAFILRMDELRKIVTPRPTYSDSEREYAYRALVFTARTLVETGKNVIIDATGNKRSWRQLARDVLPCFMEVYLKCPVEICMKREKTRKETHAAPRNIYQKGSAGWPVPGINAPYEEPENPALIIDTEETSPEEAADRISALFSC